MMRLSLPEVLVLAGMGVILVSLGVAHGTQALPGALIAVLFVGTVLATLALIVALSARRTRQERERFLAGRAPLADSDFLREMGAAGDYARFCRIVRAGLAIDCGAPPEALVPTDRVRDLERLCFDGFYLHEILFALEEELPAYLADLRGLNCFRGWKTMTLRDLIERSARELGLDTGADLKAAGPPSPTSGSCPPGRYARG
jgi:hypothetical protein